MTPQCDFLYRLIKAGHHKKIELMGLTDKAAGTLSNQLAWLINQKKIKRVGVGLYEVS